MEATAGTVNKIRSSKAKKTSSEKSPAPFRDKIPLIASIILGSVDAEAVKKIILFGSYAYGKPHKQSDIDLCVIVPNRRNGRSMYAKMALALSRNNIMPVDLLVYKEKWFVEGVKKNGRGIESVINAKGKVLYGC